MIITISGVPGSGKTTVAKILAERLGMKFYSMGDLRGKMATERGLTIDELNKLGETEAFTDNDVDTYQT
ncbi:AAA family ATPase, partial [Patescibacteria group bacterium]|nr:AAA family ATPase [Patescibacteria group bacterium]